MNRGEMRVVKYRARGCVSLLGHAMLPSRHIEESDDKSSGKFTCLCHYQDGDIAQECGLEIALDDEKPKYCPYDGKETYWSEINSKTHS